MLINIGRSLAASAQSRAPVVNAASFEFLNTLPTPWTYTRSDTAATIRDSDGKLQSLAANTPRFNHDENGRALGLHIEASSTNKCENYNAAPSDLTGVTLSSGSAVLSIVDDTSALASMGLDEIGSGAAIKIDNSTSGSSCTVDFAGTFGNTNPHSLSIWVRMETGAGDMRRTGSGSNTVTLSGDNYQRYMLENETPSSSSSAMRIRLNPGAVAYCILNQLEEGAFCTSEIIVAGSAATRQQDALTLSSLDAEPYFDEGAGFIAARFCLDRLVSGTDQYLLVASDGTSANTLGLRIDSTADKSVRGYVRSASSNKHVVTNGDKQVTNAIQAAGICWQSGAATILSGGMENTQTYSGDPSGIDELTIGKLGSSTNPLYGHIQCIEIGKVSGSNTDLGSRMYQSGDLQLVGGGQSLMVGHFDSQESAGDDGKAALESRLREIDPDKSIVWANAGTGSSAASKTTQASNFWWDLATSSRGDAFDAFYTAVDDAGLQPSAILWSQGEQDSHQIGLATTRSEYKQALEAIFADMRSSFGDIPVFIQKIGRRSSFANTGGMQAVREVQQELIDENSWCHFGAESFDQGLYDATHLDDAGYATVGQRLANAVAGYFGETVESTQGPYISDASLDGETVTVTLAHDGGTDFTPTSGIEGFHVFDSGGEMTISSAIRGDANTVVLTLTSTPSGATTLYYVHDAELGVNTANLVMDNASLSMPLQAAKFQLQP